MCIQLEFLDFLQSSFTKAFLLITTLLLNVVWQEIKNTSKGKTECITLTKKSKSPLHSVNILISICRIFNPILTLPSSFCRYLTLSHCLKITQNVAFEFLILAFSTNICPIKSDLSGKTVWPQASGSQKLANLDHFGIFNYFLSTQNVNVARLARNVEWDFFCYVFSNTVRSID